MTITVRHRRWPYAAVGAALLLLTVLLGSLLLASDSSSSKILFARIGGNSSRIGRKKNEDDNSNVETMLEGVTYTQLRRAVINKYTAVNPETNDLKEQFMESLEAMSFLEKDGYPIPIHGVAGKGLYVGSIGT